MAASTRPPAPDSRLRALVLAALGVVYGDIGTSPLYAIRECFHGAHAIAPTPEHVLGVLSLVFWSLVLVVSVKYLLVVLRADNNGEGGILALMALVCPPAREGQREKRWPLVLLGLLGASLLYGDGMITPAISVLSAIEGLKVAAPAIDHWVVPLTIAVLVGLFLLQSRGTARVGQLFGPVTLLWFVVLSVLGVVSITRSPTVLLAIDPRHAMHFFAVGGWQAIIVLGTVFLVVTGGEALYADMGHFGARPIRIAWFWLVLPALLLNYFGQGALLLRSPEQADSPFFHLAPGWAQLPLVGLATAAAVIASQAMITGAFSLTWQAIQLGYLPRMEVRHTSEDTHGQIYVPGVSRALLVATVALVLGFRSSSNLASAYGVAVTTTMVITTILAAFAMRQLWRWPLPAVVGLTLFFLTIDLAFFGSNIVKVAAGGWFPLLIAALGIVVMTTWRTGRKILWRRIREQALTVGQLFQRMESQRPPRVPGTVVFLTGDPKNVPPALVRILEHLHVVHERVVLLTVTTADQPFVASKDRLRVEPLKLGFYRVTARYGFMEKPNVPGVLLRAAEQGLEIDLAEVRYVFGRETLLATERPGMMLWRERLFAFMSRNAGRATDFFRVPSAKVIEIGAQIEL